ncbi:acetyl-CoA hydrolase/transferase family protein [Brevibacterium daeguense]|uniref:Acetyl-CoA hydrolase/transferase family protein n=1 Tax=Brevibacterium daeguense TaxID=909936 RepID=A0ABP8EK85_9MICO
MGMSGFTGSGYPKAVPGELAQRMTAAHAAGDEFTIGLLTGASTSQELDGVLAKAKGVHLRAPFNTDPDMRRAINAGDVEFIDTHLSHLAQQVWFGYYGKLDVAVIEVAAVLPNGLLVPGSSVGNNKTWLDQADKVILEVNEWHPREYEGFHDVYYGTQLPPRRNPIEILRPDQRIGDPYLRVDPKKVVAIVETNAPDRDNAFAPVDEKSEAMAGYLIDFLRHEVRAGRMPDTLLPIQSGSGNVANAVLDGLKTSEFEHLTSYTEVIQDNLLGLLDTGTLDSISATAFSLSREAAENFNANIESYKGRILLRPQEMSNHPEIVRRLGLIAINGMVEADIYGHVNSTHVSGSRMLNGIGGSGDFARNAFLNFFVSPSTAKNGVISTIVPMASHVDHTEHDVHVLVTEQGIADLRGTSPIKRARRVIDNCAHPDYRDRLHDYLDRAIAASKGAGHSPHILSEALSWHTNFLDSGQM